MLFWEKHETLFTLHEKIFKSKYPSESEWSVSQGSYQMKKKKKGGKKKRSSLTTMHFLITLCWFSADLMGSRVMKLAQFLKGHEKPWFKAKTTLIKN